MRCPPTHGFQLVLTMLGVCLVNGGLVARRWLLHEPARQHSGFFGASACGRRERRVDRPTAASIDWGTLLALFARVAEV